MQFKLSTTARRENLVEERKQEKRRQTGTGLDNQEAGLMIHPKAYRWTNLLSNILILKWYDPIAAGAALALILWWSKFKESRESSQVLRKLLVGNMVTADKYDQWIYCGSFFFQIYLSPTVRESKLFLMLCFCFLRHSFWIWIPCTWQVPSHKY